MNNLKTNFWLFNKKSKDIMFSYELKQKGKYIKGSILAIVCGLIIAGIVIAAQDVSPFTFLRELFRVSFSGLFINQTIQWLCIYIIAGLAVGIGFKSGLFNIGVSGQMLMGAGVSIIFYSLAVKGQGHTMNGGYMVVIFLICTFTGAIMAGFAGLLKSLFNIHEVVTTIMLNWTAWYLMKYLFLKFSKIAGDGIMSSASIPTNSLTMHGSTIAIPIIFAGLAVIVVSILLAKTVFGHKLKAVGLSKDASKYAGYNVKTKVVQAMAISGALAGIASFINICTITPNISFSVDNLPSTGYDAIAITLVAFNNPIGIAFTSLLWGILQSGGSSASSLFNMPNQTSSLVFGIIVYFAAIAVVFMEFYPILKLRMLIALETNKKSQLRIKNLHKQQMTYRKNLLNISKADEVAEFKEIIQSRIKEQKDLLTAPGITEVASKNAKVMIAHLKKEMNEFVKEYRKNLKEQIAKINEEIKVIKKETYANKMNSALTGINRRRWKAIKNVEDDTLGRISLAKSDKLNNDDTLKNELHEKNHWLHLQKQLLKKDYKIKIKQNNISLEGLIGEETHRWIMSNGLVSAKDEISRIKLRRHNQIINIKADYLMDKLDLNTQLKRLKETNNQGRVDLKDGYREKNKAIKSLFKNEIKDQNKIIKDFKNNYKNKIKGKKDLKVSLGEKRTHRLNMREGIDAIKEQISQIKSAYSNQITEIRNDYVLNKSDFNIRIKKEEEALIKAQHDLKKITDDKIKVVKISAKDDIKAQHKIIKDLKLDYKLTKKYLTTKTNVLKDLKVKHDQKAQQISNDYAMKLEELKTVNHDMKAVVDKKVSKAKWKEVKTAIAFYKNNISKDLKIDSSDKNLSLLKQLKLDIRTIWSDTFDEVDNGYWSNKRFKVYKYLEAENVKWVKQKLVLVAKNNIKLIDEKQEYTKKTYKRVLSEFKSQYKNASVWKSGIATRDANNREVGLPAESAYRRQIENYIKELDDLKFNSKGDE